MAERKKRGKVSKRGIPGPATTRAIRSAATVLRKAGYDIDLKKRKLSIRKF